MSLALLYRPRRRCRTSSSGIRGRWGICCWRGRPCIAVRRRYPRARLTALGHPERWGLLSRTLSLARSGTAARPGGPRCWATRPLPAASWRAWPPSNWPWSSAPIPGPPCRTTCARPGFPGSHWVPSFPDSGREPVAALQARHLAALGLRPMSPGPFRLALQEAGRKENPAEVFRRPAAWLAVAPGSGHRRKNWPLSHYYEVTRALAWEYKLGVVWLAGPAEAAMSAVISGSGRGPGSRRSWPGSLWRKVAAVLSRCRLFLGNDSGLTHLAAALGGSRGGGPVRPHRPGSLGAAGKAGADFDRDLCPGPVRPGPGDSLPEPPMPGRSFSGAGFGGGRGDILAVDSGERLKNLA